MRKKLLGEADSALRRVRCRYSHSPPWFPSFLAYPEICPSFVSLFLIFPPFPGIFGSAMQICTLTPPCVSAWLSILYDGLGPHIANATSVSYYAHTHTPVHRPTHALLIVDELKTQTGQISEGGAAGLIHVVYLYIQLYTPMAYIHIPIWNHTRTPGSWGLVSRFLCFLKCPASMQPILWQLCF